ncbi:MAG TPA: SMP-30/gluconolactonase/LRE family protein [Pseudomonadales bacterium]|nr:SMP-30/gluconolactonase/LRE family protein [Pseudomonadales bacterium]
MNVRASAALGLPRVLLLAVVTAAAGCSTETTPEAVAPAPAPTATQAAADCAASDGLEYLCGPQSAEDLVLVPGTSFVISSGYGAGAPFYLIDAADRSFSELVPTLAAAPATDLCPGAPDLSALVTHGLNLQPGDDGHSTLYVVGHGGREAIEMFDVDATGDRPALVWTNCLPMADGMEANSVASRPDGSLLFTVPLDPGRDIGESMAGEATGAVHAWAPGGAITLVEGTRLPYPNGIEFSADGSEFFVASSGGFTVSAYSNTNPARLLRTSAPLGIVPDNLHAAPDGTLLTAGLVLEDEACGVIGEGTFELETFATCPRAFLVKALDPATLEDETIASGPADPRFSNVTMALPVDGELWIGTFAGDRVAIAPALR